MAKSLDGLIHHLLDHIALCGEHGALPSHFISLVREYYSKGAQKNGVANGQDAAVELQEATSNVDRLFLERVWRWLIQHPDIQLGDHAGHEHLTLSEVEVRNAAIKQAKKSGTAHLPFTESEDAVSTQVSQEAVELEDAERSQAVEAAPTAKPLPVPDSSHTTTDNATGQYDVDSQMQEVEHHPESPEKSGATDDRRIRPKQKSPSTCENGEIQKPANNGQSNSALRLYTSEDRMWRALAGHGPDSTKIKALDFACLAIIGTCGPKGIHQHELVKMSGQDKRSLPSRTDRLHVTGYIEKKRVRVQQTHPKRFLNTSHLILKRFAERSLPREEHFDEPEPPAAENTEQGYEIAGDEGGQTSLQGAPSIEGRVGSEEQSRLVNRPVPQWTPDRSLSNQIFELVSQSGTRGMTMKNIRDNLFGEYVRKPVDEYIARLVECWQVSQPLHLRHLSIVRDTVLRGKTSVYNYYTFDNFKRLVENGTGFWEAIRTMPDGVTKGINVVTSLKAEPQLDEFGFPILDSNLFQGRSNDATLKECISGLNADRFRVPYNDPILKTLKDGTSEVQYKVPRKAPAARNDNRPTEDGNPAHPKPISTKPVSARQKSNSQTAQSSDHTLDLTILKPKRTKSLVVKPRGRPRIYSKKAASTNAENNDPPINGKLKRSLEMAEKYVRTKIEKEILWRIEEGGDAILITHEVLAEVENLRQKEGQEPLSNHSRALILHAYAGGPEPEPINVRQPKKQMGRRKRAPYWPSMAAHTIVLPDRKKIVATSSSSLPERADAATTPGSRKRRLPAHLREPENETETLPIQKKRRRMAVADRPARIFNLPSVAAHSWPLLSPLTSKAARKTKRRPTQLQQFKGSGASMVTQTKPTETPLHHSPLIATHSSTLLPPRSSSNVGSVPQNQTARSLCGHDHDLLAIGRPKDTVQTPFPLEEQEVSQSLPHADGEGLYPGWIKFMSKYYEPELRNISRPRDGIFIGETKTRRKRNVEPVGLRPRSFKVAIFKSTRLQAFEWFAAEVERRRPAHARSASKQSPKIPMQDKLVHSGPEHSLATPITEVRIRPRTSVDRLDGQSPTIRSSDANSIVSLNTPCPTISGMKRKRNAPDDSGRGSPTSLPISFGSPQERDISVSSMQPPESDGFVLDSTSVHRRSPMPLESTQPSSDQNQPSLANEPGNIGANSPHCPTIESAEGTGREATFSMPGVVSQLTTALTPEVEEEPAVIEDVSSSANENHNTILDAARNPTSDISGDRDAIEQADGAWPLTAVGESLRDNTAGMPGDFPIISRSNEIRDSTSQGTTIQTPMREESHSQSGQGGTNVGAQDPRLLKSSQSQVNDNGDHELEEQVSEGNRKGSPRPSDSINRESSPLPCPKVFARMNRRGGSVAMMRRNIVMGIMETCEGVFGGHREMARPFAAEWARKGQGGRPEEKTIYNVIHTLCSEGQLREIEFAFRSKQGNLVTKSMLTLPNVDHRDPKVKDLQKNIMAHYPRNFLPKAVMALEEPSNTDVEHSSFVDSARFGKTQKIMDGKNKTAKATLAAIEAQEKSLSTDAESQREKEDNPSSPIMRVPRVNHLPPSHVKRPAGRPKGGRVERLESARKISKVKAGHSSLPRPAEEPLEASSDLMWLPEAYAFSEFNFEEERRTVLEPATHQDNHRFGTPYGSRLRPWLPSSVSHGNSPAADLFRSQDGKITYISPYAAESDSSEDAGESQPVAKRRRLVAVPDRSRNEAELRSPIQPRQKREVPNFMDAIHYFQQTTGTFSVGFSGLAPFRLVTRKIGTCSRPYSLGPRNFHSEFPAPRAPRYVLPKRSPDSEDTPFEKEVDDLLERELETAGLEEITFEAHPFVNHTFHHVHMTSEVVDAKINSMKEVVLSSQHGRPIHRKFPSLREARPKIGKGVFNSGIKDISPAAAEALRRIEIRMPMKRRRLTSLANTDRHDDASIPVPLDDHRRPVKFRRIRAPRDSRPLGEEGERQLLTAVMIIRTLTGGLEKRIDWVLVAKAFGSEHSQMFLNGCWNYVFKKHKMMLPKMESDFQDLFTEAYEEDSIPALDFDDLAGYDWKWLTEWTMRKLITAGKLQPDLPAKRVDFDKTYDLKKTSKIDISGYYGISGPSQTVSNRTNIINSMAFVCPVPRNREESPSQDHDQLDLAKTWIRANIVTPEHTYNPTLARAKLGTLPTEVVEDALKQLLLDKVLSQENKGRLIPGRNYDVSEHFVSRLKKNLHPEHFQRAVNFKLALDQAFEYPGSLPYSPAAYEGDMLTIINLLAHKRINLISSSIPLNKWGQTDGSYESRHMDKGRLNFDITIHPSPTYIAGNPLLPLPEPPKQHLGDPTAKIPLWYDIHDALVPVMWETTLAATMAVLVMRPGLGAEDIAVVMKPGVEAWELEWVLEWMVEAKAAVRVEQGYMVGEWWYLAFEGGMGVNKGKEKEEAREVDRAIGEESRENVIVNIAADDDDAMEL